MRPTTAALAALATVGALAVGWHEGTRPQPGLLAGVHVVAAPPAGSGSGSAHPVSGRTTPSRKPKKATKAKKAKKATTTAPSAKPGPAPGVRRSVDGAVVSTPYGDVQVSVVVLGRRIIDVQALHLTDANGRSRQISASAAPVLRREALMAQSARIDAVSGASYTSQGYQQSLQAALDDAHL